MTNAAPSAQMFSGVDDLDRLHALLADAKFGPGWNKSEPSLYPAPKKTFVPAHWSFALARAALDTAGDLVSTELAERRNLILANPIVGNTYATARTIVAAYQMVKAGETARSHRHTPNALRLVLESEPGSFTIVQGKKVPMRPGDVLLTPNWLWHGHSNESGTDAYWIDFLDAPLVQLLEPMFFEHFPEGIEKVTEEDAGSSMRFPWDKTQRRLDETAPDDKGVHEIKLGDPALASIGLAVRRLEAGAKNPPLQTTANNIYAVIEGSGETEIDGQTFQWSRGDILVAPAWRPHTHTAGEKSHLLRVSDEPVLSRLNWLKTQS